MTRVPARRQAPRRALRRLPSVDHVQAAADRLLRLPSRAGGAQRPVRHRVRALPHDARRSTTSSRCTTSATSRCGHARQPRVRACHKDNRPLAGSGNLCINCHRQDDIHSNSLSPRCGECHTQWSFAPARFDHVQVGCNLTGLHRTLACFDCHRTATSAGCRAQCAAATATTPRKGGVARYRSYTTCATCHNPNFWGPAQPAMPRSAEIRCADEARARARAGLARSGPRRRLLGEGRHEGRRGDRATTTGSDEQKDAAPTTTRRRRRRSEGDTRGEAPRSRRRRRGRQTDEDAGDCGRNRT